MNNKPDVSKLHKQYDAIVAEENINLDLEKNDRIRFPYEFFNSVERGWISCDIVEVDTEKELVKVCFYNPDAVGWNDNCSGGLFDEVVQMWRVRLRED